MSPLTAYFYKLILLHFLELKISYNTQFCRVVLFNTKDILIGARPPFYRSWLNKNFFLIQDLLGDDGKVLSFSKFIRKFQLNGNFLHYTKVVSAIPKDLIDDPQRYHIVKTYCILSESSFQLSAADLSLDLLKMKNRSFYWLLKWERDLLPEKILAKQYFSRVKNICRDNKLRGLYFKLLHSIVVEKRELFTYGKKIAENALCPCCKRNDSIIHTLYNFQWTKWFCFQK